MISSSNAEEEKAKTVSFLRQRKFFEPRKTIIADWNESEWFQVWLQLARRHYHGIPNVQNTFPVQELAA